MAFDTGRGQFGVSINGTDMMVGSDNLEHCYVIEHAHTNKPSVDVAFLDNKQAAGSWGIFSDGAQIDVQLGDSTSNGGTPTTYSFNQYGVDGIAPKAAGDLIPLSGVANVMQWFTSVVNKAYTGNASDAIQQAAQDAGITKTDIDSTQDSMTWLPDNRTFAQWARKVCDHAFMGTSSSPFMALTSDAGQWMLRLKDIMTQSSSGTTTSLISHGLPGAGQDGSIGLWDFKIKTHGGALNSFANYGLQQVTQDLGGDVLKMLNLDITSLVGALGLNSQLAGLIQTARVLYPPASIGNTHANYHLAHHANTKSRATYTVDVTALSTTMSTLKILDDVPVQLINSQGQMDPDYSLTYKVSSLTRGIQRGTYVELIGLTAQGSNSSGSSA